MSRTKAISGSSIDIWPLTSIRWQLLLLADSIVCYKIALFAPITSQPLGSLKSQQTIHQLLLVSVQVSVLVLVVVANDLHQSHKLHQPWSILITSITISILIHLVIDTSDGQAKLCGLAASHPYSFVLLARTQIQAASARSTRIVGGRQELQCVKKVCIWFSLCCHCSTHKFLKLSWFLTRTPTISTISWCASRKSLSRLSWHTVVADWNLPGDSFSSSERQLKRQEKQWRRHLTSWQVHVGSF